MSEVNAHRRNFGSLYQDLTDQFLIKVAKVPSMSIYFRNLGSIAYSHMQDPSRENAYIYPRLPNAHSVSQSTLCSATCPLMPSSLRLAVTESQALWSRLLTCLCLADISKLSHDNCDVIGGPCRNSKLNLQFAKQL